MRFIMEHGPNSGRPFPTSRREPGPSLHRALGPLSFFASFPELPPSLHPLRRLGETAHPAMEGLAIRTHGACGMDFFAGSCLLEKKSWKRTTYNNSVSFSRRAFEGSGAVVAGPYLRFPHSQTDSSSDSDSGWTQQEPKITHT